MRVGHHDDVAGGRRQRRRHDELGGFARQVDRERVEQKIYSENKNYTKEEIRSELRKLLSVDEVITSPSEPFDIFGHADGMVRFIDEDTVLLNDYSLLMYPFHNKLVKIFFEHNIKVELIPCKVLDTISHDKIPSAIGNYINYLQLGDIIILPKYEIKEDDEALKKMHNLFPQSTIRTIDCNSIANEGGVLNCVTWNYFQK